MLPHGNGWEGVRPTPILPTLHKLETLGGAGVSFCPTQQEGAEAADKRKAIACSDWRQRKHSGSADSGTDNESLTGRKKVHILSGSNTTDAAY